MFYNHKFDKDISAYTYVEIARDNKVGYSIIVSYNRHEHWDHMTIEPNAAGYGLKLWDGKKSEYLDLDTEYAVLSEKYGLENIDIEYIKTILKDYYEFSSTNKIQRDRKAKFSLL